MNFYAVTEPLFAIKRSAISRPLPMYLGSKFSDLVTEKNVNVTVFPSEWEAKDYAKKIKNDERAVGVIDDTELYKIWFKLNTVASLPIFLSDKTLRISVFHDCKETTPLAKFRYDACITRSELPLDFQPEGNVGLQTISGGLYAVIRHHGSLKEIDMAFREV